MALGKRIGEGEAWTDKCTRQLMPGPALLWTTCPVSMLCLAFIDDLCEIAGGGVPSTVTNTDL